jgi:hypothetical protein
MGAADDINGDAPFNDLYSPHVTNDPTFDPQEIVAKRSQQVLAFSADGLNGVSRTRSPQLQIEVQEQADPLWIMATMISSPCICQNLSVQVTSVTDPVFGQACKLIRRESDRWRYGSGSKL